MGCYVDPPNMDKRQWLEQNGTLYGSYEEAREQCVEDHFVVCLVQNSMFSAAPVLFNEREVLAFTDPSDMRPKQYYVVGVGDLKSVSDLESYMDQG